MVFIYTLARFGLLGKGLATLENFSPRRYTFLELAEPIIALYNFQGIIWTVSTVEPHMSTLTLELVHKPNLNTFLQNLKTLLQNSKAYIPLRHKKVALGPGVGLAPQRHYFCVGDTNMLVSENAKICVFSDAKHKICVSPDAIPQYI